MGGALGLDDDDLLDGLVFEFERRRDKPPIMKADDAAVAALSTEVAWDKILPVLDRVRPKRDGPAVDGSSMVIDFPRSSY
jgi:hypothetical protein